MTDEKRESRTPEGRSNSDDEPRLSGASSREFRRDQEELEQWIKETPPHATVKGMYVESFLRTLDRAGKPRPTRQRFVPFKDYPLPDLMRMMLDSVTDVWPDRPPRQGLRFLGQSVYSTLTESTVGRVMFSVAGRSWTNALTLTEKAYRVSLSPGTAKLADLTDCSARIELRNIWNFTDCYQVGVMEGAMKAYEIVGTVQARPLRRRCDADLLLAWDPRSGRR